MPFAIKFFKSFDKEESLATSDIHSTYGGNNEDEKEAKMIDFSHPNFSKT